MYRTVELSGLTDALAEAQFRLLHIYVGNGNDDWINEIEFSKLRPYEDIVLLDVENSKSFLLEANLDRFPVVIAVGQGFYVFKANNLDEFTRMREATRVWVEAWMAHDIKVGNIDPVSYRPLGTKRHK